MAEMKPDYTPRYTGTGGFIYDVDPANKQLGQNPAKKRLRGQQDRIQQVLSQRTQPSIGREGADLFMDAAVGLGTRQSAGEALKGARESFKGREDERLGAEMDIGTALQQQADQGDTDAKAAHEAISAITKDPEKYNQIAQSMMEDQEEIGIHNAHLKAMQTADQLGISSEIAKKGQSTPGKIMADVAGGLLSEAEGRKQLANLGKKDKGTTVNIKTTQESAYAKERGKKLATQVSEIEDASQLATKSNEKLNRMDRLLEKGIYTGAGGESIRDLKRGLKAVGLDPKDFNMKDDVGITEAFNVLAGDFVMDTIQRTKGSVSEWEMAYFAEINAGLGKTPAGNKMIIDQNRRLGEREKEKAEMLRDWEQNVGPANSEFFQKWADYVEANPLYTQEEYDNMERIANESEAGGSGGKDFSGMWK